MRFFKTFLVLTVFLCSLMPLQSISAGQDSPTLRVQLFEDACGGEAVSAEVFIVYDENWNPILETPSGYSISDYQWSTNLVIGELYHVEAYSENMLIASEQVTLHNQNNLLQFCNEDTSERVPVSVAVYDADAPLEGVRCMVFGYNHYANPPWERQPTNERYSNSQGICSWELYPSTQNIDLERGEKYKIEFEHVSAKYSCERYAVPTSGYQGTLVFDISSAQAGDKNCERLLSTHLQDLQDGNSHTLCNPNNDANSGRDSEVFFNKASINPTSVSQGGVQLFHGCLGGSSDLVDVYTYDAAQYATIKLFDENDVVHFTSHTSSMIYVGGGSTTEMTVKRKNPSSNYAPYRIEVVVDSERTNEFLSITQPRLMNLGPEVINCVAGGKASLLYNVADPQGHLDGSEIIVLGQTIINSRVTIGTHEEHIVENCLEGTQTLELRSDSGETLDTLTFYFTNFDVLDTTDNVLFTDQSAFIYLTQPLKPGNCISLVQVSQRDALNTAAGFEANGIRTSSSPWTCGVMDVYKWQFQAKFLGSLSNSLLVNFKTGVGATPQLIHQTDIYVLPRCSEVLEQEGISSVESYLFIDCEGNEAGLVAYVDNGAGDLSQNKWEILNNWDESESILFFSKTTVISESGDSYSHVPLLVPTLIPRCQELDQSLTQLRDLDPGPGGIWNWVDVVGTAPEFWEAASNYNEVSHQTSSPVKQGDCMVHSEYYRAMGQSIAVLPVIDDWDSMAFLPATDTSTERLLQWCEDELLRCDPVTRDSDHSRWDGEECSSYLEYSIVLTYLHDDPMAASFQWEGPMGKYDPAQPQVWYNQATECLAAELLRQAQFEQSLNTLFLLIDIISVAATIASAGTGAPMFVLSGMVIKNTVEKGVKEGSERWPQLMHKVCKNSGKSTKSLSDGSRNFQRAMDKLPIEKQVWKTKITKKIDELPAKLEQKLATLYPDKAEDIVNLEAIKLTNRVRESIGKILVQSNKDPKIYDYIDDFVSNPPTTANRVYSYIWEIETLADVVKRIKATDRTNTGLKRWDGAIDGQNKILPKEFGDSYPDFVFENVAFRGKQYKTLVIEAKLSANFIEGNQFKNLQAAVSEDGVGVVYSVKNYDDWKVKQLETALLIDGIKAPFDILYPIAKKIVSCSPGGSICITNEIQSIAIVALSPAFLLPSGEDRGRSLEPQFFHISSTCSEESFLLSSYGLINAGVLWAYVTLDDEGINIHHDANCEILIEGVKWSTEVQVDEESGEVVPVNTSVSNPRYVPSGPVYSVNESGSFQNIPPVFNSLNPFTSTAIVRGDGVTLTSYYLDVEENEQEPNLLTFDFSKAVTDLDGSLDDMQLQVGATSDCNYRDYFFIQTQGLNLSLTPIPNASTDMVMGTVPHQTVPESGFYCSVLLLVYDSPFPPATYPDEAEYIQGIGVVTLHVRLSDVDGQVEEQEVMVNVAASNDLLGFILLMMLAGLLVVLRRSERESRT